jgi:hypothetical protein
MEDDVGNVRFHAIAAAPRGFSGPTCKAGCPIHPSMNDDLARLKPSAHVGVATADSQGNRSITFGRSLYMIIELGKVTEETQNQEHIMGGFDFGVYREIVG